MADCEHDEPLKITLSAGSGSVPTFCELVLRIAWDSGILGIPRIVRIIVIQRSTEDNCAVRRSADDVGGQARVLARIVQVGEGKRFAIQPQVEIRDK